MPGLVHMLLGAVLVALGVLAAGLADRVRGIRLAIPRERTTRSVAARFAAAHAVEPLDQVEPFRTTPRQSKPDRTWGPRTASNPPDANGGDDVIGALVAAGYKKSIATEATYGCNLAERATVEDWTRAALRRCARGGLS